MTQTQSQSTTDNTDTGNEFTWGGHIKPTEEVKQQIAELRETDFILPESEVGEEVGANLDDDERVRSCMGEAAQYFHEQLPEYIRAHITEKWGIVDEMIDAKKLGFVDSSNSVIDHLRGEGFSDLTIARTGIASAPGIRHVFECGVSRENADLLTEDNTDELGDCHHRVSDILEVLVRGQMQGLIEPEEINLTAVVEELQQHGYDDELYLQNWWDNRITFPYFNEDNEIVYLIGRATEETDDRVYDNGSVDRSGDKYTLLRDTELARKCERENFEYTNAFSEFAVLPNTFDVFGDPYDEENHQDEQEILDIIEQEATLDVENPLSHDTLVEHGLIRAPEATPSEKDSAAVRVFDADVYPGSYDTAFVMTAPVVGIDAGEKIEFVNHTSEDVTIKPCDTPDGEYWEEADITGKTSDYDDEPRATYACEGDGHYKYKLEVGGETHRGMVDTDVVTGERVDEYEWWAENEALFELDIAKYLKNTVQKPWINSDAIYEPLYGVETVREGKPLVLSEGIADAVAAHQSGIPSISPATTNIKKTQYPKIAAIAEKASKIVDVGDNETSNAGLDGSLKNARMLEKYGHTATVGILPRPESMEKIDLAEYLKDHTQDEFVLNVLDGSMPPREHQHFTEEIHEPTLPNEGDDKSEDKEFDSDTTESSDNDYDADEQGNSKRSALYDLELPDVVNTEEIDIDSGGGKYLYRGVHPIRDHAGSDGYFVFIRTKKGNVIGKDFAKQDYIYNARTWLAAAANCACDEPCDCTRTPEHPFGDLKNSEHWWAWHHAKKADHIPFPDDDRVPVKAIWFLADYHNLLPSDHIPESFDESKELPPTKYNEVLDIIENHYGLNSGRKKLKTSDDDSKSDTEQHND